jgi:hypothetical protein
VASRSLSLPLPFLDLDLAFLEEVDAVDWDAGGSDRVGEVGQGDKLVHEIGRVG